MNRKLLFIFIALCLLLEGFQFLNYRKPMKAKYSIVLRQLISKASNQAKSLPQLINEIPEENFNLETALILMHGFQDTEYTFSDEYHGVRWKPSLHEKRRLNFRLDLNLNEADTSIAFDYSYTQGDFNKHIIITETYGGGGLCRLCGVPLGGAVFTSSKWNSNWRLDNYQVAFARVGLSGRIAEGKIFNIGPEKKAIMFGHGATGQGYTHEYLTIVTDVNDRVDVVFLEETGNDNWGAPLLGTGDNRVWRNSSEIKFVSGQNPDYYDIIVETSGTRYVRETDSVSGEFREVKRYLFKDEKYRLVE
ncbi:MAG: hypothetical protein AAGA60_03320 [Cyanobacteria bacterium P01_E01_bin.42]